MIGLAVLVVDRDPIGRSAVVSRLRRLGMHAIGADAPADALVLLDGIAAEVVVVRSHERDPALFTLRARTLLVQVGEHAATEDVIEALLHALGQTPAHPAN